MSSSERPLASKQRRADDEDDAQYASMASGFVRLSWAFFGPVVLVGYLAWLLRTDPHPLAPSSLAFWVLVLLMVMARFVDVTRYGGETSTGTRATLADARRFAVTVVGVAAAAWLGVHLA